MMCGIPVITNVLPEFVNEIGFGIIVEYGNIDQIRSAIIRLRDDPELRKRLGDNGRKAFLQKYNWDTMEKKLYMMYTTICYNCRIIMTLGIICMEDGIIDMSYRSGKSNTILSCTTTHWNLRALSEYKSTLYTIFSTSQF